VRERIASPENQLDILGDLHPDLALAGNGEDGQARFYHLQLVNAKPHTRSNRNRNKRVLKVTKPPVDNMMTSALL